MIALALAAGIAVVDTAPEETLCRYTEPQVLVSQTGQADRHVVRAVFDPVSKSLLVAPWRNLRIFCDSFDDR